MQELFCKIHDLRNSFGDLSLSLTYLSLPFFSRPLRKDLGAHLSQNLREAYLCEGLARAGICVVHNSSRFVHLRVWVLLSWCIPRVQSLRSEVELWTLRGLVESNGLQFPTGVSCLASTVPEIDMEQLCNTLVLPSTAEDHTRLQGHCNLCNSKQKLKPRVCLFPFAKCRVKNLQSSFVGRSFARSEFWVQWLAIRFSVTTVK